MSYYHDKVIGTILSTCYTTNSKRQCWDPILAALKVNMYVVQNLNSLYSYTLCTVMSRIQWQQGTVGQTMCVLLFVCYTAYNVICAYIGYVQLTSVSPNFSVNSAHRHIQMSTFN